MLAFVSRLVGYFILNDIVLMDQTMPAAILKVPPEIFPLIASHLPLQLWPATLSAFTLTARCIYPYVNPVLYSRAVVQNEDRASQLLKSIITTPRLGQLVRELHVRIDITEDAGKRQRRNRTTALVYLQRVVEKQYLPNLNFFRLVLLRFGITYNDDELKLRARYDIPRTFWTNLRKYCPLLRGLYVQGIGGCAKDPWSNEPEFYDLKDFLGLEALGLKFECDFPTIEFGARLSRNLANMASSLQSLTLFLDPLGSNDVAPLFSVTFPLLRSISLSAIYPLRIEVPMNFWARHPNLERVNAYTNTHDRWFADGIEAGLLPRLNYLRAIFEDIRALTSHLNQLEHLYVAGSYNCQVPYLLRSVLPGGLPNLRRLDIYQIPYTERSVFSIEGATWYETEDSQFFTETKLKNVGKVFDRSYVHSIVEGAPNLEQFCFQGGPIYKDKFIRIAPILARLRFLKGFYYRAFYREQEELKQEDLDDFWFRCRLLGNLCQSLEVVTDVAFYRRGPYLVGKIIRGGGDSVVEVIQGTGFGMESPEGDNDPFPLTLNSH